MSRLRTLAVVGLALAGLAAPVTAQGARTQVSDESPSAGPHIAGDQVVYRQATAQQHLIRAVAPGGAPRTLRAFPVVVGITEEDCCLTSTGLGFAASATRLATLNWREDSVKGAPAGASLRLAAGPLDGPDGDVYTCFSEGPLRTFGAFDLDGDRLAYVNGACPGDTPKVVIRDLAAGADVAVVDPPAGSRVGTVKLAGRYLAIAHAPQTGGASAPAEVVVRDLTAGTEVLRAPVSGGYDLQADGKITTLTDTPGPDGCPTSVGWHSPADPARHPLPVCPASAPRMSGDRVLIKVSTPAAQEDSGELVIVDLAGAVRPLVVSESQGAIWGDYDLEDGRAAYAVGTCIPGRSQVFVDDLGAGGPLAADADCPVTARGGRVRASRSGAVVLALECPNGCGGTLALGRRGSPSSYAPERTYSAAPGTVRVTLKLRRGARRKLLRDGRLKARIAGTRYDLRSSVAQGFGRNVTLLAPRGRR